MATPSIREQAIQHWINRINIETLSTWMKRVVEVYPQYQLSSQIFGLLQFKANQTLENLKKLSGKNDAEWAIEEQEIQAAVATMQTQSPELFMAHHLPKDPATADQAQLQQLISDTTQAFHSRFI